MSAREGTRQDLLLDERYRQLVELAPDAILIHDGERIVLANAAALRLAGATRRDQLVNLPISAFLDPPYLKAAQAELLGSDDLVERTPPVRDTFRRLDGSAIDVEVSAIAFMDLGSPSVHLVIRDIADRLRAEQVARRMEEQLRQAQRMEAVGALAGGVAHEVNNMMTVILGFSDFMLMDPAMSEERLSEVREIAKAADRAASVTGQLLAFSRRAFHQPKIVDLGAAVRAIESVIRRVLGENRRLVLATGISARAWIDPGQLDQVIVNLALNARDAMPRNGTFMITTTETELSSGGTAVDGLAIPPGRFASLVLRDNGVGMDPATQARIFEPFFTTKPLGQGTGLGLAAVYGIMKQNLGYIAVNSAPDSGTTFTLYFPFVPGAGTEQQLEPAPAVRQERGSGRAVLVVEDETGVRRIAARILEQAGFRVLQAADGVDALDLVDRQGPPDLVLTDLVMPGVGGAELARRLRSRWPTLPILFMSGYSSGDLGREGADHDGELIRKPFSAAGLVSSVVGALLKAASGVGR